MIKEHLSKVLNAVFYILPDVHHPNQDNYEPLNGMQVSKL